MDSVKTIRAVQRAFDVLRALQDMPGGATLMQLQQSTGLSGPTVLRMLKTLMEVKAVHRSTTDQRYRNSVHLQALARSVPALDRLGDVAAPWLDGLCRQVEWPSDLAVHQGDDDFMAVLESSLSQSRFYVRRARGRVRVNLLGSAAGMAYLSALTPERRIALVDAARRGHDVHNAMVIATGDLEARVREARRQGYASRHPTYRGGSYNSSPRDNALSAIAVPIVCQGCVLGALNINWNRAAMDEVDMVRRHLKSLRAAAEGIAASAAEQDLPATMPGLEAAA